MWRKTTVWILQATNWGNLEWENESLFIAAKENTIGTNFIKEKVDYILQNSECMLCVDRGETMNVGNWWKGNIRLDMAGWIGDPLRIVQKIKIWTYYQKVYAQTRICARKMNRLKFSEIVR